MSNNRAWARTGTDAVLSGAFFLGAWWLVPLWRAAGLATAFAIAYTCASIALWICLRYQSSQKVDAAVAQPSFAQSAS
jgi:hypothetical protein